MRDVSLMADVVVSERCGVAVSGVVSVLKGCNTRGLGESLEPDTH